MCNVKNSPWGPCDEIVPVLGIDSRTTICKIGVFESGVFMGG